MVFAFDFTIETIPKVTTEGNTQPKLCFAKGIYSVNFCKPSEGLKNPITSGMLNTKVTIITALNTTGVASFSGKTFSKISIIVIGYTNNNTGIATTTIELKSSCPTITPNTQPMMAVTTKPVCESFNSPLK